ncbi:hypothetical protein FLA_3680 [Filimonas lacunae]|nr:hypothetical protein FLA_0251 [Filimonas lacunae]BAV07649.1 hypothetical protein FLA_3680 [Filimonas lacunae]
MLFKELPAICVVGGKDKNLCYATKYNYPFLQIFSRKQG